jgi:ABC-2 type transport system permease protein
LLNIGKLQQQAGLVAAMPADAQRMAVVMPFGLTASVILLISFVVGAFYCFDALNTERRDRSILFWKSMPVSDAATVLSKAFVPMAVQPAVGFAVALATQAVLLVLIAAILKVAGVDPGPLWAKLPVYPVTVAMLYGLVVHVLWYAPAFALFLLLSAWVRRPLLWVVVPVVAVQAIEKLAFGTSYSGLFLRWRVAGAMSEAFAPSTRGDGIVTSLAQLEPVRFLSSPGLWAGLAFAAFFIYAAIRLRRHKEPL